MRPAFSSTKSATGFVVLFMTILLLPAVMKKSWLPPRAEAYLAVPWQSGPYPFLHQQIFEEKANVDIAFIGSSHIWYDIDTSYVQAQLSNKLARPANVITLGWPWAGFDATYFISLDLLRNRKVKLLVIYDEVSPNDAPQVISTRWFRWRDDTGELAGLPWPSQAALYTSAVIGMPRNLLSRVRPNQPAELISPNKNYWEIKYNAPNPAACLGALTSHVGYDYTTNFADFTPETQAGPKDVCVFSAGTNAIFQFNGPVVPPYQLHFMQLLADTARRYSTRIVLLHLPEATDGRSAIMRERTSWRDLVPAKVTLMGIPPENLFSGLSDAEIRQLFLDQTHLNANGQRYFTRLITSSLLDIYDQQTPSN
jgi:hypothetical protein